MKLLKFLFKHFLIRSTRNPENIRRLIRNQGFQIYRFHPCETTTRSAQILRLLGATEYAQTKQAFIATNDIIKGVFIRTCLCKEDELLLLWHEEAHIWYEHPHHSGYLKNTPAQKENIANLFLFKIRLLKAFIYFLSMVSFFIGTLHLLS